ncbi:hypothetical protein FA15DRAFT_664962 [Coprinopsis marcescibilis]|uniref:Uncharacterized protein n=1 Tax=Coprinopsis marcescibilis TaxID=230819 RepID=A0A5C3L8Q4_COPMA|nr:hypothetical protein FA15DRAFT_664962 [Coprinopsis marcescibilis]
MAFTVGLEHRDSTFPSLRASKALHSRQASTTSTASSRRSRISLASVLERFPNDFRSLIRPMSISTTLYQEQDDPVTVASATADSPMSDLQRRGRASLDMKPSCPNSVDERPSRRSKFETRIYNFLTRSRSRSRSKQEKAEDTKAKGQKQMPRSSIGQGSPATGAKPASRIPSRPLSSTTTATNTTAAPGTPKARRTTPTTLLEPSKAVPEVAQENEVPTSRSTTPKSSLTKKKLQSLFGIPLGLSSRKSSRSRSRSRPNSPEPSTDVPPLPTAGRDDNPTPKLSKSHSPHSSRPHTPTNPSKPRPPKPISASASTGSTSSALRLPKLFSGRAATNIEPNQSHSRPSTSAGTPLKSGVPVVSGPLRRPSSVTRRILKPDSQPDSTPSVHPTKHPNGTAAPAHIPTLPNLQLAHHPNTPLKAQSIPESKRTTVPTTKAKLAPRHTPKFSSMDAGYRYRGGNMSIVDEEGRNSQELSKIATPSLKGKTRESEPSSHLRTGTKMSTTVRNTKHGSFDFERPGWATSIIQRTGSTGTNGTATSSRSRNAESSTNHDRDSGVGPGLAGVGTLQRDMSIKRAKDTEEQLKARERGRKLEQYIQKDKLPPLPTANGYHSDHVNGSTSTTGTAQTGKSSSLSKATGKKSVNGHRSGGSGVGLTRLTGTTQHPPFSFEPPVPSPTYSTGSNGTATEVPHSWAPKPEKTSRPKEELKRRDTEKKPVAKGDRPPVPVPAPSTQHRFGYKGRSLDLGLKLAWAPSTMKEEALLPSSTVFARSNSSSSATRSATSSGVTRTASSSTNGHDGGRSRKLHVQGSDSEAERSKLGKEVAELFRNVLDDRSFNTFKTYVRQFDAHEITFDGRHGIVERVERLLANNQSVTIQDKRIILEKFVRIILQHA